MVIDVDSFIIEACTDLGTHVDGSHLGPDKIVENYNFNNIKKVYKSNVKKSKNKDDINKNIDAVNEFNSNLYDIEKNIIRDGYFPITLGGDHSLAIGSALASIDCNNNLGIIWIDSHGDFNTPETTETGNIHGYPFAAICGYHNKDIVKFHQGSFFNPKNAVLVGARDIDIPYEAQNLKDAGVTVFTTEDLIKYGPKTIMKKAIDIAGNGTSGIHVSYDLDAIDPSDSPGVSIPAKNGFDKKIAYEIFNELKLNSKLIKSMDIVEFNPLYDINNKTLDIALDFLDDMIKVKKNEH